MTAQAGYTDSQRARAAALVENAKLWTRGRRKRDGLAFVLFGSSKPGHAYYANEFSCTCSGFLYRGKCSHELAVRTEAEAAREQFAPTVKTLKTYEEVYGLVDAF